ncbi:MAG: hypothetical protein ACRDN0_28430 [Trebonia sp.]
MNHLFNRRTLGGRHVMILAAAGVGVAAVVAAGIRKHRVRCGAPPSPPRADGGGPAAGPGHASAGPPVLQVLSGDLLRQRTAESHARGYVNLVGMLQA